MDLPQTHNELVDRLVWIPVQQDNGNFRHINRYLNGLYKGEDALPFFEIESECTDWCDKHYYDKTLGVQVKTLAMRNQEIAAKNINTIQIGGFKTQYTPNDVDICVKLLMQIRSIVIRSQDYETGATIRVLHKYFTDKLEKDKNRTL